MMSFFVIIYICLVFVCQMSEIINLKNLECYFYLSLTVLKINVEEEETTIVLILKIDLNGVYM